MRYGHTVSSLFFEILESDSQISVWWGQLPGWRSAKARNPNGKSPNTLIPACYPGRYVLSLLSALIDDDIFISDETRPMKMFLLKLKKFFYHLCLMYTEGSNSKRCVKLDTLQWLAVGDSASSNSCCLAILVVSNRILRISWLQRTKA